MTGKEAVATLGQVASGVGRALALLGGLVAFGYGAAQALGYQVGVLPGARMSKAEARLDTLTIEFRGIKTEHTAIFRELHGIIRVGCVRLTPREREVVEVCADDLSTPQRGR